MSRTVTEPLFFDNARIVDPSRDIDAPGALLVEDGCVHKILKD